MYGRRVSEGVGNAAAGGKGGFAETVSVDERSVVVSLTVTRTGVISPFAPLLNHLPSHLSPRVLTHASNIRLFPLFPFSFTFAQRTGLSASPHSFHPMYSIFQSSLHIVPVYLHECIKAMSSHFTLAPSAVCTRALESLLKGTGQQRAPMSPLLLHPCLDASPEFPPSLFHGYNRF